MKLSRLIAPVVLLFILALGFVSSGGAQTTSAPQPFPFKVGLTWPAVTAGSGSIGAFDVAGLQYFSVDWVVSGTVSACSVTLDGNSSIGGAFSTGSIVSSQSCTSTGTFTTSSASMNIQAQLSYSITGSGSVTFTVRGFSLNPASSSGSAACVTTVSGLNSCPGQKNGTLATVTDGTSATDCTTGGGVHVVACQNNGTTASPSWGFAGGAGGGVNPGTQAQQAVYNSAGSVVSGQTKPAFDPRDISGFDCTGATDDYSLWTYSSGTIQLPNGCIVKIGTNLSIPAAVTIQFGAGAEFAPASGVTITVNGSIVAGNRQQIVNTANGTVVLNGSKDIYVGWYGAPQNGVSDDAVGTNAALSANPGKNVYMLKTNSTPCSSGSGGGCVGTIDGIFNSQVSIPENTSFGGITPAGWPAGPVQIQCSNSLTVACIWMPAASFSSKVHDLMLYGQQCWNPATLSTFDQPTAMDGTGPDGFLFTAGRPQAENVTAYCFERHGFAVLGNNSLGDSGQPDFAHFHNITSYGNRGWGLYFVGGDSNAGTISGVETTQNQLGGIFDNSQLGNTFTSVGSHSDNRNEITAGTTSNISSITGTSGTVTVAMASGVSGLVANSWITIAGTTNYNGTFKLTGFTNTSNFTFALTGTHATETVGTAQTSSSSSVYAVYIALGGQFTKEGADASNDGSSQSTWINPYCESTSNGVMWGAQTIILGGDGGHGCVTNIASGLNPGAFMVGANAGGATFYTEGINEKNLAATTGLFQMQGTSNTSGELWETLLANGTIDWEWGRYPAANYWVLRDQVNSKWRLEFDPNGASWIDAGGSASAINFQQNNGGTGPINFFTGNKAQILNTGQINSGVNGSSTGGLALANGNVGGATVTHQNARYTTAFTEDDSDKWYDVRGFGALGNSNGTSGNGHDDSTAIATCLATQARECFLPALNPGGVTYYRWATAQSGANIAGLASVGGIKLRCGGSNTDLFTPATGAVVIAVDMGGLPGPPLMLGSSATQPFNGAVIDNCMAIDISTSLNSPGWISFVNTSNVKVNNGGATNFQLVALSAPTLPGTLGTFTSGGVAQSGTATFTNGSATVAGSGTSFQSSWIGATVQCTSGACNGSTGVVSSVASTTSLTLTGNFGGTTGSGVTFAIGITPATTLFETATWIGPGGGSSIPSSEGSQAFSNCTTLCHFVPNAPATIPAGAQGIEIFLATSTGNEKQAGVPFACVTASCPFSTNLNFGAANTSATAIYVVPTAGQGGDVYNHTEASGYYSVGTSLQNCGVHGDSCISGAANQIHFTHVDCSGMSMCLDMDAQAPVPMLSDFHCFEGSPGLSFAPQGCVQSESGIIENGMHLEGPLTSSNPGAEINVSGFVNHILGAQTEHASSTGTTGISGKSLKYSFIEQGCALNIVACFTDDANSGHNFLFIGNVQGTVTTQPTDMLFQASDTSIALNNLKVKGTTSGTATISATATGGTLNLGSTNATVTSAGALTVVSCTGCGSGTVNAANQYYSPYYSASGSASTLSGTSYATTPNGVPQTIVEVPSGGALTAPTAQLPGISGRAVTGTTSTDTILATDCSPNRVEYVGSVAVAITLPTATTLAVPACVFKLVNNTTGVSTGLTVTPTTWTINGASSLLISPQQSAWIYVDPNSSTNWVADVNPLAPAFGPFVGAATIQGLSPYFVSDITSNGAGTPQSVYTVPTGYDAWTDAWCLNTSGSSVTWYEEQSYNAGTNYFLGGNPHITAAGATSHDNTTGSMPAGTIYAINSSGTGLQCNFTTYVAPSATLPSRPIIYTSFFLGDNVVYQCCATGTTYAHSVSGTGTGPLNGFNPQIFVTNTSTTSVNFKLKLKRSGGSTTPVDATVPCVFSATTPSGACVLSSFNTILQSGDEVLVNSGSGAQATGLSASESGSTVTVTSTLNPGVGSTVNMTACTPTGYNSPVTNGVTQAFTVTVSSGSSFQYTDTNTGLGAGSGCTATSGAAGQFFAMEINEH